MSLSFTLGLSAVSGRESRREWLFLGVTYNHPLRCGISIVDARMIFLRIITVNEESGEIKFYEFEKR